MNKDKSVLILDNLYEYKLVKKYNPELAKLNLILISGAFPVNFYKNKKYKFIDNYISLKEEKKFTELINKMTWDWFLDNKKDLSKIDGFSLGSVFSCSVNLILNSIFRYKISLENMLKYFDTVYCLGKTEVIFLHTIKNLEGKINFKLHFLNYEEKKEFSTFKGFVTSIQKAINHNKDKE